MNSQAANANVESAGRMLEVGEAGGPCEGWAGPRDGPGTSGGKQGHGGENEIKNETIYVLGNGKPWL